MNAVSPPKCQWKPECHHDAVKHVVYAQRAFETPINGVYPTRRIDLCEAHTAVVRAQYLDVSEQDIRRGRVPTPPKRQLDNI